MKLNKKIQITIITSLLLFFTSCTTIGVARFPSNQKIFLTTASEDAFVEAQDLNIPYQPLGVLEYQESRWSPFGSGSRAQYSSLEKIINNGFLKLATRKLGADSVIDFKSKVTSSQNKFSPIYYSIPYIGFIAGPILGDFIGGFFNINTVKLTGLAIKKNSDED